MPEITNYLSDLQIERLKPSPDRLSQHWLIAPHSCPGCDRADITSRLSHRPWLRLVPMAMSALAIGEWWVGDRHHSLSLLADAGHLWFDALAIWLSLAATYITHNPRFLRLPWLYEGADAIAALANGWGMLVMTVMMLDRAIAGLSLQQPAVFSVSMPLMALGALGINCGAVILLHPDRHRDLNFQGLWLHALADVVSSAGAIGAAAIAGLCHWSWLDPVISLGISGLTICCAVPLITTSWQVLWAICARCDVPPAMHLGTKILTAKTYSLQQLINPQIGDLTQQCIGNIPSKNNFALFKP